MKTKYKYHAKAIAISGALTRPLAIDIGELAATELRGEDGGYDTKRLENHRIHEIFSVGAAYTQVTANEGPEGHFNTMAIATVENLNILDILKADRITCRLVGLHCCEDFDCCEHPYIHPMGSTIENLRVGGKRLDVPHAEGFQLDFDKPHSYAAFRKTQHHYATPGTTYEIPGFGTITCGKLEVTPIPGRTPDQPHRLHNLAMLTVDLGSPVAGRMMFAVANENGSPPDRL